MDSYVPRYHRVFLVDDHDIVRRGLRDLLVTANDIDVVGDSASARESVPQILRLDVDVVLLDLHLQDGSGIEVCRAVRAVKPSVSGLLLTASGDDEASLKGYWDKLSAGGTVAIPLEKAPCGDSFGMLPDKFGVSWMVNIAGKH